MRVGVFLSPWGPLADPAAAERFARAAEAEGFASLWVGDHVVFPRQQASSYLYNREQRSPFDPDTPLVESVGLLAYLAGITRRIELGVSVLVLPLRHPVLAARQLADVQALSGGRLAVGVGVGWMREEFDALGTAFDRRGAITDEAIAVLRHLWGGSGQPFTGHHFRLAPLGFAPRPEPIPLVVGGNSDAALRRAARLGDGWHPLRLEPEEVAERLRRLEDLCRDAGRDPAELRIVLRTRPLDPGTVRGGPPDRDDRLVQHLGETLARYRDVGVDDFIVEFPYPGSPPERQVEWLGWLAARGLVGAFHEVTA